MPLALRGGTACARLGVPLTLEGGVACLDRPLALGVGGVVLLACASDGAPRCTARWRRLIGLRSPRSQRPSAALPDREAVQQLMPLLEVGADQYAVGNTKVLATRRPAAGCPIATPARPPRLAHGTSI